MQGTAFNNSVDPAFERKGELERKREGSRKRNKKEASHCPVFENCEKSTLQSSCGKSDGSIGNGEIATKKTKQSRHVNRLLFHFQRFGRNCRSPNLTEISVTSTKSNLLFSITIPMNFIIGSQLCPFLR